jgi:hypothetical protein
MNLIRFQKLATKSYRLLSLDHFQLCFSAALAVASCSETGSRLDLIHYLCIPGTACEIPYAVQQQQTQLEDSAHHQWPLFLTSSQSKASPRIK